MLNGDKIWKNHPMAMLHYWQPGRDVDFPHEEFPVHHQILEATLSLYGLHATQQSGVGARYHFFKGNAKTWAQVACALYGMLEKRLFTPYFDGKALKSMPRASMDPESIAIVADYLDTFSMLLDLPPLQAVFMHKSFTTLLVPHSPIVNYVNSPRIHVNGARSVSMSIH
jgi:hypothetical protein